MDIGRRTLPFRSFYDPSRPKVLSAVRVDTVDLVLWGVLLLVLTEKGA